MKNFIKEWGSFILTMTLMLLAWLFIFVNVQVDGHSMDPTLAHGDRLFVLKVTPIDRFDIVVAQEEANGETKRIVKRVVGMPGDTISYHNDVLTINGIETNEPYLAEFMAKFQGDKLQSTYAYSKLFQELALASPSFTADATGNADFTVTVPEGEYFLIGDDRIVSKDSRHVGTFKRENIIGEVMFRFWPFNSLGTID
ncbi:MULTISPECIES: signal peptidase I [unclassified Streptococcus]|uniref:signal peptidase I n=1 Tax=unclassified Streptococcus TaxID=2608887 RepID=UPI00359D07E8